MDDNTQHIYLISLGSNTNPYVNLEKGRELLCSTFENIKFSRELKNKGIGLSFECWYVNQMALVYSFVERNSMTDKLKSIEQTLNRKHHCKNVTLDLDLVKIDGEIVHKNYNMYPFLKELGDEIEAL